VPELTIDPGIRDLLTVGLVEAAGLRVGPANAVLAGEIGDLCAALASRYAGRQPSAIDGLSAARRLYRAFGIDPTSTRPSSEALLRRILQGKPFPAVNAAVDVCNLCSTTFLLPIGLYDAAKIQGRVTLRRGAPGESYPGIRKDIVNIEQRPVLVDESGPFGNPTSDSRRTSVDATTTSLWMVVFAPADYPRQELDAHVAFAGRSTGTFGGSRRGAGMLDTGSLGS
jgi:DNA/RNA-binding domain of Phe-tRNA-synthetase-like protein